MTKKQRYAVTHYVGQGIFLLVGSPHSRAVDHMRFYFTLELSPACGVNTLIKWRLADLGIECVVFQSAGNRPATGDLLDLARQGISALEGVAAM